MNIKECVKWPLLVPLGSGGGLSVESSHLDNRV